MEENTSKHKIVLIGDPMVGKTAILTRLIRNYFCDSYSPTVGTGFGFWDSNSMDLPIRLHIWDTAGTEQYRSLAPIFYQNAEAAIVVYSQRDIDSEKSVEDWIVKFREAAGPGPAIAIAANQADRKTTTSVPQMNSFAEEKGYIFLETSAKTGEGITQIFEKVAEKVYKNANLITKLVVQPRIIPTGANSLKDKKNCC